MRLLNTTSLEVESFVGQIPQYAILSHRWQDEEVTLDDLRYNKQYMAMEGFKKLENSAFVAKQNGFGYIWIDTCCIDKTSSAELTEAIGSMYSWYHDSGMCIAYLSDISGSQSIVETVWLSRGWTLQELIAPPRVHFYDSSWEPRGTKHDWADELHKATSIPPNVLAGNGLSDVPVCCKMAWAASRATTRPEDVSYCLLGLFDVNIPVLYGEGGAKAFKRLQEAILSQGYDESIFAWTAETEEAQKPYWGLLAQSPAYFANSSQFTIPTFKTWRKDDLVRIGNGGLWLTISLLPRLDDPSGTQYLAVLNCSRPGTKMNAVEDAFTLTLQKLSEFDHQYARVRPDAIVPVDEKYQDQAHRAVVSRNFVGFDPRPTDPVLGFCIDQSQRVRFDFPTNTFHGPKIMEGFTNIELEDIDKWKHRQISKTREVYFTEIKPVRNASSTSEINNPEQRRLDAYLKINCRSFLEEQRSGPGPSFMTYHSQMSKGRGYEDPYLLVGFEPLPENATKTPHGFVKPWYSFKAPEEGVDVAQFDCDSPPNKKVHTAPGSSRFKVELCPVTLNFRTFYDIRFVPATKKEEEEEEEED